MATVETARHELRDELAGADTDAQLDVVVCGSMARQELTPESDFDYLILAHGLVDDPGLHRRFRTACQRVAERNDLKPPGKSALFGRVVSAPELVETIGLEFDTNSSLTRRVLLLEEGVSVFEPRLYERFVRVTIDRYVYGKQLEANRTPRFLLNDVARYWRTIAVDYQAKVWESTADDDWGLRYLKLRISRKLTFAATVVSLFLSADEAAGKAQRDFLVDQFVNFPPLARLAQLLPRLAGNEAGASALKEILTIADEFSAYLSSRECREAAKRVKPDPGAPADEAFTRMTSRSHDLQVALERLFFDARVFDAATRRYLAF